MEGRKEGRRGRKGTLSIETQELREVFHFDFQIFEVLSLKRTFPNLQCLIASIFGRGVRVRGSWIQFMLLCTSFTFPMEHKVYDFDKLLNHTCFTCR